jgi:hypothetical protein
MTDIVLRDIDPVLAGRIRELAQARGWSMHDTLLRLIEQGLYQCEEAGAPGNLDHQESDVLQAAIAALEQVPDDPGFALIGRIAAAAGDEGAEPPDPTRHRPF